jgi:biopolymer transport protein ExbB/TolQ
MGASFAGVGFALSHATTEGKITIAVLLFFSLVSWTVIIGKFRQIVRSRKMNEKFLTAYSAGHAPLELYEKDKKFEGSPLYEVYSISSEELKRQMTKYGKKVPFHGISATRIAIERGMGEANINLESGLIILATSISGGPFVGLLGTVWGVMDTFSGIARAHQANLTAMAPGVSAALITTVVGLMVAIPSLFCYNYLVSRTREITVEIDNFGAHLDNVFTTEYLRERNAVDPVSSGGDQSGDREESQREAYPLTGSPHPGTV